MGIAPEIVRQAIPFLYAMACGLPAQIRFVAMRVFLQGTHRVRVVAFAMVSANLVNLGGQLRAHLRTLGTARAGRDRLGNLHGAGARLHDVRAACLHGSGSTAASTGTWAICGQLYLDRIAGIVRRGAPVAAQIALEVGVFSAATLLAGRLGAVAVSGHQIALILISLTFMVPLGVAQATSVRVGNAIGRRDAQAAEVSGWSGIALSAGFMSCSALVLWTLPLPIVHIFTYDPQVVQVALRCCPLPRSSSFLTACR